MNINTRLKLREFKLPLELEDVVGSSNIYELDCPGVYYLEVRNKSEYMGRYLVSKDAKDISDLAKSYGKPVPGVPGYLTYKFGMNTGWHVIEYEERGYLVKRGLAVPGELRRIKLENAWAFPEYFGEYPVAEMTPVGKVISYRTVGNGVHLLKTSSVQELLSVSYPAKEFLSKGVREKSLAVGYEEALDDIFFPMEFSCLPIFELLDYPQKWIDPELIDRAALFNTICYEFPRYAVENNFDEQKRMVEYYDLMAIYPNLNLSEWTPRLIKFTDGISEGTEFFKLGDGEGARL